MAKEEEVAEVEEVEVIEEDEEDSYRSSRSSRRSKSRAEEEDEDEEERPSRLKAILAIIAVIIIILAIFLAYFFYFTPAKEMHLDSPQQEGDGIRVTCHVVMECGNTADGDADIEIFYDNDRVYSDTITINRDDGLILIDYDQFVIGNSDYTVKVTFRGKSESKTFNLHESPFYWTVVEKVEVYPVRDPVQFNLTGNTDVDLNVAVNIKDKDGNIPDAHAGKSTVTLKVKHESGFEHSQESKDVKDVFGATFSYNYLTTGSGNYTYEVTWENLQVKSDSEYRILEYTKPSDDGYQNMDIVADAGDISRTVTVGIISGEETEEFDASDSKNDGEITAYQWDFDFKDDDGDGGLDFTVDETGERVSYTYTSADVGTIYTVALRVWGKGIIGPLTGVPEYEFAFVLIEVTVRSGIS